MCSVLCSGPWGPILCQELWFFSHTYSPLPVLGTAGLCWPGPAGMVTGSWTNLYVFIGRTAAKTSERLTLSATALTLYFEDRAAVALPQHHFVYTPQSFPGAPLSLGLGLHSLSLTGLAAGGRSLPARLGRVMESPKALSPVWAWLDTHLQHFPALEASGLHFSLSAHNRKWL